MIKFENELVALVVNTITPTNIVSGRCDSLIDFTLCSGLVMLVSATLVTTFVATCPRHMTDILGFVMRLVKFFLVMLMAKFVLLTAVIAGCAGVLIAMPPCLYIRVSWKVLPTFALVVVTLSIVLTLILSKMFTVCITFWFGHFGSPLFIGLFRLFPDETASFKTSSILISQKARAVPAIQVIPS